MLAVTRILHGTSRHVVLAPDSTRAGAALETGLSAEHPTLFIFDIFTQADLGVINATSCLRVNGVLHAFREVSWERWGVGVDSGHDF
jgi:hypothetical protein